MRGQIERRLRLQYPSLAGIDEVGRGCLAGPVYAAAVVLDYDRLYGLTPRERNLIRDSKTLSLKQRQGLVPLLQEIATSFAVARAEVCEIETRGIVGATFLAMRRAIERLDTPIDLVLVDGRAELPAYQKPQRAIVKGDDSCYCIAAASILAKVSRDAFMAELAQEYPVYGFEKHVGYGTKAHLAAIQAHGICKLHRRTFSPIADSLGI